MTSSPTDSSPDKQDALESFRSRIDMIDANLIRLLSERTKLVVEVGKYKKAARIPIMQPERVRIVLEDRAAQAATIGMNPEVVREIWNILIKTPAVRKRRCREKGTPP